MMSWLFVAVWIIRAWLWGRKISRKGGYIPHWVLPHGLQSHRRNTFWTSNISRMFAHVMPNMFTSAVSIFADVFNTRILKTNIDQDAAALGAAAIAAVGCGLWSNFEKINAIHKAVEMVEPDVDNNRKYEKLLPVFVQSAEYQAQISDSLREIEL